MCSVTSVSSSTICGPHAILENYEEFADKIVSTKIANIAVGNFGIDRASEAADAPQDKQHTEVLQLRISLGDGKKLCPPSYSSPSPLWTYEQYVCTNSTTV